MGGGGGSKFWVDMQCTVCIVGVVSGDYICVYLVPNHRGFHDVLRDEKFQTIVKGSSNRRV